MPFINEIVEYLSLQLIFENVNKVMIKCNFILINVLGLNVFYSLCHLPLVHFLNTHLSYEDIKYCITLSYSYEILNFFFI